MGFVSKEEIQNFFTLKEQGQREESPRKVAAMACLIINNKRIINKNYNNLLIINNYELLTHFQPMFTSISLKT